MSEYTQGICQDGAAILKNGLMMTIEEILGELRLINELSNALQIACSNCTSCCFDCEALETLEKVENNATT